MKKKFTVFCLAVLTVFFLTACPSPDMKDIDQPGQQWEYKDIDIKTLNLSFTFERYAVEGTNFYTILVDKETGVCYLEFDALNKYAITPLLNADGTPKIWEAEETGEVKAGEVEWERE